jgi:hypothetical protein
VIVFIELSKDYSSINKIKEEHLLSSKKGEGEGESNNHYRDFILAKGIIRWL